VKSVSVLVVAAVLAAMLASATAQPFADVPTNHWAYDAIAELAAKGVVEGHPDGSFRGKQPLSRFEMAMIVARILARIEAIPRPQPSPADLVLGPALAATQARIAAAEVGYRAALARQGVNDQTLATLKRLVAEFRAELAALGVRIGALESELAAIKSRLDQTLIVGNFTYSYVVPITPGGAAGDNYRGPGSNGALEEANATLEINGIVDARTSIYLRLGFTYASGIGPSTGAPNGLQFEVERLYLNLRNLLGVEGLDIRLGRDVIALGPIGLLLDSDDFYDDQQRDGIQLWFPSLGPVDIFLFAQSALADQTSHRSLMGGRAEIRLGEHWLVGLNLRVDTAALASAAGTCPGACNTGTGYGVDLSGELLAGAKLTLAYATYTPTRAVSRSYWQGVVEIELERVAGIHALHPVVKLWYKDFDPYVLPGGVDGTTPRGLFGTPDDFKLFNINDNLTAWGARLDLEFLESLGVFLLGEWGRYKAGGPGYTVWSAGFEWALSENVTLKLAYSSYNVGGGAVTTTEISGVQLVNAALLHLEVGASW